MAAASAERACDDRRVLRESSTPRRSTRRGTHSARAARSGSRARSDCCPVRRLGASLRFRAIPELLPSVAAGGGFLVRQAEVASPEGVAMDAHPPVRRHDTLEVSHELPPARGAATVAVDEEEGGRGPRRLPQPSRAAAGIPGPAARRPPAAEGPPHPRVRRPGAAPSRRCRSAGTTSGAARAP